MERILVSVFNDEPSAFEGLTALKELHRDGDITLYASTVIAKAADGTPTVRQEADRGPIGTLVGVVGGSLVGLLGGPVGFAVGAYIGGIGGLMYDLFNAGVSVDFVDEVSASLTPGTTAVVADIDETWVTPVDTRLSALGATIFRRQPGEVADDQLSREAKIAADELDQLGAELRESTGEAKANVKARIERQREKVQALVAKLDKAIDQEKSEFDARMAKLNEQRKSAKERQQARIDARIADLKAQHQARDAKLAEAKKLAKESLDLTREAIVL
ncbi:MAG TPA: DUF1269 domain-containing protein [Candidatus Dormibacteraeota bacterium]|nr:DUF1269 domain-containing protein [Candidatus Dormibacteraeota bacterium]